MGGMAMKTRLVSPGGALWSLGEWRRDPDGPTFARADRELGFELSGQPGWCSNGGPGRSHPFRAKPTLLELDFGESRGALDAIVLIGVFARWASSKHEAPGTLGASLQYGDGEGEHIELVNGRHYGDAEDIAFASEGVGDGCLLERVGSVMIEGVPYRVDALTVELVDPISHPGRMRFRDLGSPASFVLFDVAFRWLAPTGCPFHSGHGGIALAEIGAIIRLRDRVRFRKALDQLEASIQVAEDLDEARGEALTFTAVVAAATLELGAPRTMHRLQLEAARAMEKADSAEAVFQSAADAVQEATHWLFEQPDSPNARLIERAISMVDRQYARPLTDAQLAGQLGLSPSHFRFLFRQETGQPFHKYLISVRLEKARRMLAERGLPVSEVAAAVGFSGISHFSRAFSQRFNESPNQVRNASR